MKVIMKTAFKGILAVTSIMIVAVLIIVFVIPLNSKTLYLKGRVSDLFENTREAYKEYVRWVNRSNYRNILDKYIVDNYGEILKEYFEVQVINNYSSYNQLYSVSTPFMKKDFFIEVSYNKRKVISDTFNSVLSTDPKFQHMYSEWVKKQVGIEDENVEFKLIYENIDFQNVETLDSNYDEMFENCHYILNHIDVSKVEEGKQYLYFNSFVKQYYDKINKNDKNELSIYFDDTKAVAIVDYNDIKKICIDNGLNLTCYLNQLDSIAKNIEKIYSLQDIVEPQYYKECEVKHLLSSDDVDYINEVIRTPDGKYYQDSIMRIDISDIENDEYIVDILYYDTLDYRLSDLHTKKREDVYYSSAKDTSKFKNPIIKRYKFVYDNLEFTINGLGNVEDNKYYGQSYHFTGFNNIAKRNYNILEEPFPYIEESKNIECLVRYDFPVFERVMKDDESKINSLFEKEFEKEIRNYLYDNCDKIYDLIIEVSKRRKNRKFEDTIYVDVLAQNSNFLVLKFRDKKDYCFNKLCVVDINTFQFVDSKIVAVKDNLYFAEINNKIFLCYDKISGGGFINYNVISESDDKVIIKAWIDNSWHIYTVNLINHTIGIDEEVVK